MYQGQMVAREGGVPKPESNSTPLPQGYASSGGGGGGGRVQSDPPNHLPGTKQSVPALRWVPLYDPPGLRNPVWACSSTTPHHLCTALAPPAWQPPAGAPRAALCNKVSWQLDPSPAYYPTLPPCGLCAEG